MAEVEFATREMVLEKGIKTVGEEIYYCKAEVEVVEVEMVMEEVET